MSEKKYMSINEVSKLLDIKQHVIRYWDSKFNGLSIRLSHNKQRFFNSENIKKLKEIKSILYQNGKHNYSLDLVNKIVDQKITNKENKYSSQTSIKNSVKFNIAELESISANLKKILDF